MRSMARPGVSWELGRRTLDTPSHYRVVDLSDREISAEIIKSCRLGDREAFRALYYVALAGVGAVQLILGLTQVGGVVGRPRGLHRERAKLGALDPQAALVDRPQVLAPGEEAHVMAGARQQPTVQPADASGANDRHAHGLGV